jgi:hypothetical protein
LNRAQYRRMKLQFEGIFLGQSNVTWVARSRGP